MDLILLQSTAGSPPFSAYLLCYAPLAVTVIGLFVFFAITDRDATRLNPRKNPFTAESNDETQQQRS